MKSINILKNEELNVFKSTTTADLVISTSMVFGKNDEIEREKIVKPSATATNVSHNQSLTNCSLLHFVIHSGSMLNSNLPNCRFAQTLTHGYV